MYSYWKYIQKMEGILLKKFDMYVKKSIRKDKMSEKNAMRERLSKFAIRIV